MFRPFKKIYHPFLIAIYPVLNLLDANFGQVNWTVAIRPILLVLIFTFILLLVLSIRTSSGDRAGLIASIFLILFSSYGHVYSLTEGVHIFGILIGRHRYLIILWLVILGIVVNRSRKMSDLDRATSIMNIGAAALLLIPAASMVFRAATNQFSVSKLPIAGSPPIEDSTNPQDILPDIYYIILDQYPGNLVLEEKYGFDNSEFYAHLTELGFAIADRSLCNYSQTELSLASSLNFQYVSEMGITEETFKDNRAPLWTLIKDNAIRKYLEHLGYVTIAYETGYAWSQWEDADFYLGPRMGFSESLRVEGSMTSFEVLLLRKSALLIVEDLAPFAQGRLVPDIYGPGRGSYDRVMYTFDSLTQVGEQEKPIFVFAHILSPHPPYVFSTTGDFISMDKPGDVSIASGDKTGGDAASGFIRSLQFVNQRIIDVIGEILSNPGDPIIILQGDHGIPGSTHLHRMSILNAYHLPEEGNHLVYDSISPVNTFRLILRHYFNKDIELIEDIAWVSSYDNPYKYNRVEAQNP